VDLERAGIGPSAEWQGNHDDERGWQGPKPRISGQQQSRDPGQDDRRGTRGHADDQSDSGHKQDEASDRGEAEASPAAAQIAHLGFIQFDPGSVSEHESLRLPCEFASNAH
jgi:hypothetical protein